jgi:hypothetical protein
VLEVLEVPVDDVELVEPLDEVLLHDDSLLERASLPEPSERSESPESPPQ